MMNSSGGTVDAAAPSLVDKFGAFSLGGSEDPGDPSGPNGGRPTTGAHTASTPSPPRGGAGGSGHWSSNRAPALTASTMSTYDTTGGGSANLNASTSVGSVGGAHSAGGTVSPLVFDVSPSSDVGYSGGGSRYNNNITPSLIASAGGHRRIISTGSGGSSGAPPAPPMLERDSSQELVGEVFLPGGAAGGSNGFSRQQYQGGLDAGAESFSAGIAPRPFGSSGSQSGSEDGLRGLDALSHGSTSGSHGHRERAQTMPVPEDAHHPHAQQQHHVRSWSTADHLQHLGGAGQGASASSASSRLLSSSDPPRSASFGGGRPPLATHSKTNLSDLLQPSTASSGGSPGGAGGGQQQQRERERDNSFDYLQHPPSQQGTLPVQQQRSHSIGGAYSMPEEHPVHGGDACSASASASMPRPLNQHARSYSQGSVARPSAGTPLYSVSIRERFSTSDGIAEHQPYGGSAAQQHQQHQLPRSVSTGSNIVMYTDGREYSPSSTSASMRRSDSAPGHMVSPSYQHYQQDQSVHGGSRFSANRYSQPHHQQQHHQHQQHQQPQYHVADEYHEPIVLPQYGVATMPRPPAASSMGPGPKIVYHVQFKRSHHYFVLGPRAPRDIEVGTFVKVEADRGEDLGQIIDLLSAEHFNANCRNLPTAGAGYGDGGGQGGGPGPACAADLKRITRRASREEADLLPLKSEEENELINICNDKVRQRGLPMRIVDAEYQFDRHKLTFFFESDCRVDFRELVRDLFSIYKTRIWMEQLN